MKSKIRKIRFSKRNMIKSMMGLMTAIVAMLMIPMTASAHCDTLDGPTAKDGLQAMEENNINYALKWVFPEYEEEITSVFELSMKVKDLSLEAKELAETYFLSELIRMHRAGEGAPFTGLQPAGSNVDERVRAADESIAIGDLSPMEGLIEEDRMAELEERFNKAMALKDFDVNDVEAAREYITAYVMFFKYAEGEEVHHGEVDEHSETDGHTEKDSHVEENTNTHGDAETETHSEEKSSVNWLPWAMSGLFLVTTIVLSIKQSKHKH